MNWTAEAVRAELDGLEPILKELGLKTPFQRARFLIDREKDWASDEVQMRWRERVGYWRDLLLGSERNWDALLDLDAPGLRPLKTRFEAGGKAAQDAWASYIARQDRLAPHLHNTDFRILLFETDDWELYDQDGTYQSERAEMLLQGHIRLLALEPVWRDPDSDYNWLIQHPRDRVFQNAHQSAYLFMYPALAYFHRPDPRWARAWAGMVLALIAQCPRLPEGHNDFGPGNVCDTPSNVAWSHYGYVANRLKFLVLGYLAMADSPGFSPRFHGIILRAIRAHTRRLHELDRAAYKDNLLSATGKALYLTASLLPELKERDAWLHRMWPHLLEGMQRELLDDGCHLHRSISYHLTFVRRPMSMICLARKRADELPDRFLSLVRRAVNAFVQVSTPIRSTPGINDDWTVAVETRGLLRLAADAFQRNDWRYLATDGREGTQPHTRSSLLPDARLVAMRSGWSRNARYLIFNVSPDGGHHHPDTLSIQIWAGGEHVLIDPGVGHYYTGEREIARQSWWHNCPTLGAEPLPNDPHPEILHWQTKQDLDYAIGQIQIPVSEGIPPITVRRHVLFLDQRCWIVWDEFEDLPQNRRIWENFHFTTEDLSISQDGGAVHTSLPGRTNLSVCLGQKNWRLSSEKAQKWLSYGGPGIPTRLLHYQADPKTASRGFAALFVPFEGKTPPENTWIDRIERLPDNRVRLHVTVEGHPRQITTVG